MDPEALAVRRRRSAAEQALRSVLNTPQAQCVIDTLVEQWITSSRLQPNPSGPLPEPEAVERALILVGDQAPIDLITEFVNSEPPVPASAPVTPTQEETTAYLRSRALHDAAWAAPDVDRSAHDTVGRLLEEQQARLRALGYELPIDRALCAGRWWPGRWWPPRPGQRADPVGFYHRFRSLEATSGTPAAVYEALGRAHDICTKADGVPPFDPAEWIVASTDYRIRHQGRP